MKLLYCIVLYSCPLDPGPTTVFHPTGPRGVLKAAGSRDFLQPAGPAGIL